MDGVGACDNGGHRVRGAVPGMEHSPNGVAHGPSGVAAVCGRHLLHVHALGRQLPPP